MFIYVVLCLYIYVCCIGITCYWGTNAVGVQATGGSSLEQWRCRIGTFGVKCLKSKLCLRSFGDILKDLLVFLRLCLINICDSVPIRIVFSLLTLFIISLLLPIILFSMTLLFHTLQLLDAKYEYVIISKYALLNTIRILSVPFDKKKEENRQLPFLLTLLPPSNSFQIFRQG